ncbi:MAG TPA: AAA family ATPase [Chthoniobacterales bacterium]|jgi:ATP-dependent 26S proteasome regulatory subunit
MSNTWSETNQASLLTALASVRAALEEHTIRAKKSEPTQSQTVSEFASQPKSTASAPDDSALKALCAAFGLSAFERDMLLLCAGVELDSTFAALCAAAQGDSRKTYPTFSLGLAALPEAHWSALLPTAPLRHWRMIEFTSGEPITASVLRIDERILHHLTGLSYFDERLHALLYPIYLRGELPPSHAAIAHRVAGWWRSSGRGLIELFGEDDFAKRAIAAAASAELGLGLRVLPAADIPLPAPERETFIRLWEREMILGGGALLIDCCGEGEAAEMSRAVHALIKRVRGPVLVATREPSMDRALAMIRLEVRRPNTSEQKAIWQSMIEPFATNLNGDLGSLTEQFTLGAESIHVAGAELRQRLSVNPKDDATRAAWDICRDQTRQGLEHLAQRIEPAATWNDLVLPGAQRQILREMASHVRQRSKVYEQWGFAEKGRRGLGISALFAGASGTGKTMAAEVLANELRLDLYRVDLSSVVSKYIGETEKNLRRVFDAAEAGGAILLFDEADALFGKRTEVKDSHDRYANIEVSYLLQRMEAYRGLAILTTNRKESLDNAFLRRLRFVVQFPFPDAALRAEIWRRIFPKDTPTENLDLAKLSRLNVAGGNIRNVALNAAFLAADANEPVRMKHLLRAARSEYNKLEKPLTESEIGGWT